MERRFDLVVIGTGVTTAVASRCREAGWTVAVIDSRPFGGTCALRGCLPKKILVGAAEAVHHARDMATIGVPAAALTIDWPALMRFKRSLIDPTPQRTEQAWAKIGVEQFHGRARFVDSTTLAVGGNRLVGRRVLIAAGAMPAPLKFPGADRLATSEDFLNLERMPARIVFIGGGYISFEFAHVAAREVLVEEGTQRILGAHLLGSDAAEVINLFAVAIRLKISADDLKQVLFAYPTYGSDIRFMV
jgi:glutathione reductase (NADPH)